MKQIVNRNNQPMVDAGKVFQMIDNYIYVYHTHTLIVLPIYPDSIADSMGITYNSQIPLARSAPIYSYSNLGPRSLQLTLPIHRDMMNQINLQASRLALPNINEEDYTDVMINQLQSIALPKYSPTEKMVNPPLVAVRFGNSIFCKGVVTGNVTATHDGPIIHFPEGTDKYAMVTVGFTVEEVDPYDAESVMLEGGYRGLRTTLDSAIYTSSQINSPKSITSNTIQI